MVSMRESATFFLQPIENSEMGKCIVTNLQLGTLLCETEYSIIFLRDQEFDKLNANKFLQKFSLCHVYLDRRDIPFRGKLIVGLIYQTIKRSE